MKNFLTSPRLLPVTMVALAGMLYLRSADLVRVIFPTASSGAAQAAEPVPPKPAQTQTAPASAPQAPAAQTQPTQGEIAPPPPPPAATTPIPADPPVSDSERALLLDLRKRRLELDARDAAVLAREAMLSAAQTRLAARLEELGTLQKRLEALETARRDRDEASWRGLVKLYETMKPKDAAAIFNDLDPTVLLPVLDRMKEAKAAAILAAMLPDRARTATTDLARMREKANTAPAAAPPQAAPASTASPLPAATPAAPPMAKTATGS